jgi:site-specific DNA recombinase
MTYEQECKMRVVGYIRVSTQGQVEDGVSLDAQRTKIGAWADLNGYAEVVLFTDAGISGSKMDKREALQEALSVIGKGDVLVVYSLSRCPALPKTPWKLLKYSTRRALT